MSTCPEDGVETPPQDPWLPWPGGNSFLTPKGLVFVFVLNITDNLDYQSYHPPHLKNNLLYGQFLWMKQNSSAEGDFKAECQALSKQ